MGEKKRKTRDDSSQSRGKLEKKRKGPAPAHGRKKKNKRDDGKKKGPRLPSAMRRELGLENRNPRNSDEEIDSDEEGELHVKDVYEYDEAMPEEDSKKNRRFDLVDNLEYELPEEFEDENLPSDDEDDDDEEFSGKMNNVRDNSDQSGDEIDEEDEGRHTRMLQGITGVPAEAFQGTKAKTDIVVSEAYPESEYNPSGDALGGDGLINIQDLLDPLHGKPGYSKLRKRVDVLVNKSSSVPVPLSKVEREKSERSFAKEHFENFITRWELPVKKNREAPTIFFDENTDVGFSTVGAIASQFEPRTDFENKIASLVTDSKVVEAYRNDGARLLELNKISVEDVKERQNRLAKMRSLLFRHEMKAKHIKKIKSKAFHRIMKKDKLKASSAEMQTDTEAAKELALKQEFKRAEERMTLKHKNSSKWAKRILQRGLEAQDEGTRSAISEQLHQHALLTRKMNSMKDNSSSDDSSDESEDDDEDELPAATGQDRASKLLVKAKEKTLKLLEEENDMPTSGVLSLPFMVRGLKKRKEAVDEEAKLSLQELDRQLAKTNESGNPKASSSGRRKFGAAKKQSDNSNNKSKSISNDRDWDSDSEDGLKTNEDEVPEKDVHINPDILREESDIGQESLFKSFDDIVGNPGPKTTYEVAMFASNSWKKVKNQNKLDKSDKSTSRVVEPAVPREELKDLDEDSDVESDEEMVDGVLSSGAARQDYFLPSQSELIHRAFAGDDVEEEFEKEKLKTQDEENPEPEKLELVPGWGQWTHIQEKKGLPLWMVEKHQNAIKKREDALKQRKDARLKHVIISERPDKKAERLQTKTLPFPYTSREVFEQSRRMPIGPEFNPVTSVGPLIRPDVVKKPGIIIKPIEYKDVNPYEKTDGDKRKGQYRKQKKSKTSNNKSGKKMKTQGKQKAN